MKKKMKKKKKAGKKSDIEKKSRYIINTISILILLLSIIFAFSPGKITGNAVSDSNLSSSGCSDNTVQPCGCQCSPPAKILMVLDGNNHEEDLQDFDDVYNDLISLGALVTKINEPTGGLSYNDIKDYELVWFSNPGWPMDDLKTIESLSQHIANGKAVVLQGDDMTWSMDHRFDKQLENFTGLHNINNGLDENYDIIFSDRDHPLLNLLKGQHAVYERDDVDTSVVSGNDTAVLAMAWSQVQPDTYNGPAVVLRDYKYKNQGVLLIAILTMDEIKPESVRKTFVSNIVNWMLIRTDSCKCPEGICGPGYERCINGTWSSCIIPQQQEEVCDGLDNNCNGLIDEDLVRCCESNSNNSTCKGIQSCINGVWGNCIANDKSICLNATYIGTKK